MWWLTSLSALNQGPIGLIFFSHGLKAMVWRSTSMEPSPLAMRPVATSLRSTATLTLTFSLERATTRRTVIMWQGPLMSLSFGKGLFHPRRSSSTTALPQVGEHHTPTFTALRRNLPKERSTSIFITVCLEQPWVRAGVQNCKFLYKGFGDVSVKVHIVLPYKCRCTWGHGGRSPGFNVTPCDRRTVDCFRSRCFLDSDGQTPRRDGGGTESGDSGLCGNSKSRMSLRGPIISPCLSGLRPIRFLRFLVPPAFISSLKSWPKSDRIHRLPPDASGPYCHGYRRGGMLLTDASDFCPFMDLFW